MEEHHPHLVQLIIDARCNDAVDVITVPSGDAIPVFEGKPLHHTQDPIAEGEGIAEKIYKGLSQEKLLILGFGFGYHIRPLTRRGFSPIIVEPSLSIFKLALMHVDLSDVIPFVTFYLGNSIPDIPRGTKVFALDVALALFPSAAERLSAKVITHVPEQTGDLEEGIYYATYRNITCLKNPIDLAIYQMIFFIVRPTVVIEIGTCRGGSALYFADLLRLLGGNRHVHTFDVVDERPPEITDHPSVTFHPGGWQSFDPSVINPHDRVLVIEDSAHTYENTIEVLHAFADYVTANSYFIVEDGAAGLKRPGLHGGALRAVEEFLKTDSRFELDYHWENFFGRGNSGCLKGFLRRKV